MKTWRVRVALHERWVNLLEPITSKMYSTSFCKMTLLFGQPVFTGLRVVISAVYGSIPLPEQGNKVQQLKYHHWCGYQGNPAPQWFC